MLNLLLSDTSHCGMPSISPIVGEFLSTNPSVIWWSKIITILQLSLSSRNGGFESGLLGELILSSIYNAEEGPRRSTYVCTYELEDSGTIAIKPAELQVQGLDARLLKNAGFTAAELTSAGFSPRELKVTEKHKLHFFHNALFCWWWYFLLRLDW